MFARFHGSNFCPRRRHRAASSGVACTRIQVQQRCRHGGAARRSGSSRICLPHGTRTIKGNGDFWECVNLIPTPFPSLSDVQGPVKAAASPSPRLGVRQASTSQGGVVASPRSPVVKRASSVGHTRASPGPGRKRRGIELTSKTDIGVSLAASARGGGGDSAAAGKFFRKATSLAVEQQEQLTLAQHRLAAAMSGNFVVEEAQTSSGGGTGSHLQVRGIVCDCVCVHTCLRAL